MYDFDTVLFDLFAGRLKVSDWSYCINGRTAYIMGEGSEQCLASKKFKSKDKILELYKALGVKYILPI